MNKPFPGSPRRLALTLLTLILLVDMPARGYENECTHPQLAGYSRDSLQDEYRRLDENRVERYAELNAGGGYYEQVVVGVDKEDELRGAGSFIAVFNHFYKPPVKPPKKKSLRIEGEVAVRACAGVVLGSTEDRVAAGLPRDLSPR